MSYFPMAVTKNSSCWVFFCINLVASSCDNNITLFVFYSTLFLGLDLICTAGYGSVKAGKFDQRDQHVPKKGGHFENSLGSA